MRAHHWIASGPVGLLFGLLFTAGCMEASDPSDPVLARAFDRELRWSDLRQVVPVEASSADSAAMAASFINNWLRQQVVLYKAEQNLADRDKEFSAQLRDYRNSLVIFTYEEALVDQKLNTTVSMEEIEAYYQENAANFELRDNIARVRWFKINEDDRRAMKRLEEHFLSGSPERMKILEVWLAERGQSIVDRSNTWSTLGDMVVGMPDVAGQFQELPREGRQVLRSGPVAYFVDILERRAKGSTSPVELVASDIRAILINQRKRQLIERMREDLYREALENHDIEVR